MSQLAIYLQLRYMGVLLRSMPAVVISIVFVMSIRSVDVHQVIDFEVMGYFFLLSFFEMLPWLLSIFLYINLLGLKKEGELKLIESYGSSWLCWRHLIPIWTTFSLLMLVYMGFWSPMARQVLRSQNVLSGLELNHAVPIFDGVMWLSQKDQTLNMDWWYHAGKHQAKLKVGEVKPQNKTLALNQGQMTVKSPGQGLTLDFKQGEMMTGRLLKGSKYQNLRTSFLSKKWGEIGFRLNHVFLVMLATALMYLLFQRFGSKSLIGFVVVVLLCYLPLWSYIKGERENVSFMMALLPSFFLLGLNFILAVYQRDDSN